MSALLKGPTITELSEQLAMDTAMVQVEIVTADQSTEPENILANLDQLSDSDVDALLNAMLEETKTS